MNKIENILIDEIDIKEKSAQLIEIQENIIQLVLQENWDKIIELSKKYSKEYFKEYPWEDSKGVSPLNFSPLFGIFNNFEKLELGLLIEIKILKTIDELDQSLNNWPWKYFIAERYETLGDLNKSKYYYKKQKLENYEKDIYNKKTIKTLNNLMVQSEGERKIANFLFINKIDFDYDSIITLNGNENNIEGFKSSWIRPDFYLTELDIIIEYWGLKGDKKYDDTMDSKKRLYKESGKKFISIFPKDLIKLDSLLKIKLLRLGFKIS